MKLPRPVLVLGLAVGLVGAQVPAPVGAQAAGGPPSNAAPEAVAPPDPSAALVPAPPVAPASPVASPPTALWDAASLHRMIAERDYHGLLLLAAMESVVREGEGALEEALAFVQAAHGLRDEGIAVPGSLGRYLEPCRAIALPLEGVLCSLEQLAPRAPLPLARGLTTEGARIVSQLSAARDQARASFSAEQGRATEAALAPFYRLAGETIDEVRLLRAELDSRAEEGRAELDALLAEVAGFSPDARAEELLGAMPGLDELLARYPLPGLAAAATDALGSLDGVLDEYRGFLGAARQALGPDSGALVDAAVERTWVYLASRSAEQAGGAQEVVSRIRTLGNAAVDLRQGSSTLSFGLAAGREAASLALGGNVLGVAAGITAYFAGASGGLGPDAAEEIRILREALEANHAEMGERLDGVDRQLDEILVQVTTRLERLEGMVAAGNEHTRQDIHALHLEVLGMGQRLDRMEETLRSYVAAGFDREFNRTLIVCLEHRERHLPPFDEMDFSTFSACMAELRARAERDARDALLTDRSMAVDDGTVAGALADHSFSNLARRLPLLERVAAERFGHSAPARTRELANPIEWARAAQAYLTMLEDWPVHARGVSPGDLEAMERTGAEIREALRAITIDPHSGEEGGLLEEVLAYHRAHAARLTSESDVLARRHQQAELRRVPRSAIADRLRPEPGSGLPVLEVPATIAAAVPAEVRTAGVLALDEAVLSYRLRFTEHEERDGFRRRWILFGERHERSTWTRVSMEVRLEFGGGEPVATWRTDAPWVLTRIEEMAGGEESEQVRASEELVPDPARHFLEESWPALLGAEGGWTMSPVPPRDIPRLERRIEAELRRHASAALDDVFRAVCEGDGDAVGPTGADRASVLALREALGGMTASRALLRAYVSLGLPRAAERGAVHDILFGPDAILDEGGLCAAVEAGESPLRLVWLDEEPVRRVAALEQALHAALAAEPPEARVFAPVEVTLERLEAATRVQRLRTHLARRGG